MARQADEETLGVGFATLADGLVDQQSLDPSLDPAGVMRATALGTPAWVVAITQAGLVPPVSAEPSHVNSGTSVAARPETNVTV